MNLHIKSFIFLIILPCYSSFAQKRELKHLIKYTQTQGLSSYNVRKVIQDDKGFIWVATQEGVDRFDGNSFINFKKSSPGKRKICGTDIRELTQDTTRNYLWVLPGEFGLNAIDIYTGEVKETIPIPYDNSNAWNLTMLLDGDNIWIGTSIGLFIYNISSKKFETKIQIPQSFAKRTSDYEVKTIAKDLWGNTWVCYRGIGLVIYTKEFKILSSIPLSRLNPSHPGNEIIFNSAIFLNANQVLLATDQGNRKIDFDSSYTYTVNNTPIPGLPALNKQPIDCILKTQDQTILIGCSLGLLKFDSSLQHFIILSEAVSNINENWLDAAQSLWADKENNIWIGSQKGLGFISNNPLPFKTHYLDSSNKERLEHVRCIYRLSNNDFLVGLRNGLAYIKEGSPRFTVNDKEHLYHHIFQDKAGLIHISRYDGLFIYSNSTLKPAEQFYPEFSKFSDCSINSHLFFGDSLIVLGTETDKGILLWNYVNHSVSQINEQSKPIQLQANIVNNIYSDNKENLWVLSDNIISIISKNFDNIKTVKLIDSLSKQPFGLYFDMCEAAGSYWIASYGSGIIELDSLLAIKNIFSTKNGLSNDGVYQIYNYENSLLITTNYGLSVFDLTTHTFKKYFESDGLHSNGFEEVAGFTKNGMIYVGGVKGFTEINPGLLSGNMNSPKLYITRIILKNTNENKDSSNLFFSYLKIPSNTLQTNVYFSALNFSNPTRTTFSYRIIERSPDWIDISTQNFVTLIGLRPGTYHLQVKAANEDGVWSEPKELILEFLPKWYQTWWFYVLIALVVAGILYALYRYRIAQIKKQHEIRKNIATDLHDDLGSTLNSVKVFTNLAISGVKQEESLQQIKENLNEATLGLRDMIWVLDDSLDTVDELVTRLKQFAIPVAAASNIEVKIQASSDVNSLKLTKEEKRNLFLICKETINNSIKYSGSSLITVDIKPAGKKIQITVTDNGKGFDAEQVKNGYGLKNMRYRAGQVKYMIILDSTIGKGTQIEIKPL